MAKIKKIVAQEILNSRGYPTLSGELTLDNEITVFASVPSSSSQENSNLKSVELIDNDPNYFQGRGVEKAIYIINDIIAKKIKGVEIEKHKKLEKWLIAADGTDRKEKLGANTILLLSLLFTKAVAKTKNIPLYQYINSFYNSTYEEKIELSQLPTPIFNTIAGGTHANNKIDFKEFQIIPTSSLTYSESLQRGWSIIKEVEQILLYRNANISVGKEGSFAPNLSTNTDALEIINEAILKKGLRLGMDAFIGVDISAENFYKEERYYVKDYSHPLKKDEYLEFIINLKKRYLLLYIEEPFAFSDIDSWKKISQEESVDSYISADESVSSNREKLEKAVSEKLINALVIKPIRFGTLTETLEVINFLRKNSISYIISSCIEETNDDFIADLSYATQAEFVKFGGLRQGERVAKYNRLWSIARKVENKTT